MDTYRLNVYSRWGQLVFSTLSADKGWDGTFNGSPVDLGTYFYYIQATPAVNDIGTINLKGDVTMIR